MRFLCFAHFTDALPFVAEVFGISSRPSAKTGHPLTQADTQLQLCKFPMLRAQECKSYRGTSTGANAVCVLAVLWAEPMVTQCVLDDFLVKTLSQSVEGLWW
jgi:hypothetical protein